MFIVFLLVNLQGLLLFKIYLVMIVIICTLNEITFHFDQGSPENIVSSIN